MSIGENILNLRKQKKLSQEQLGELIDVTRQTISNWELNETLPDTKQLIALSRVFNISIDELVNNDVRNIIVEKVSNTERLAGMTIKGIRIAGIVITIIIIIDIISLILFMTIKKQPSNSNIKSATLNCSIENNDYVISLGDDNYFNCSNCNKEMQVFLKDITDWANLEHSVKNVKKYFQDNGGICEQQ